MKTKALKIIGISHDEAKPLGLVPSHSWQVDGLSIFYNILCGLAPSALSLLCFPQVSTGHMQNPLLVKIQKSRLTAHLHSVVSLFSHL